MFVCTAEAIKKAYGEKPLLGGVSLTVAEAVSYTHLTLPTKA